MARTRPFVRDDIPDVVALRQQSFSQSHRESASELADYMQTMFFDGPWCDETMPSKVYEDGSGRVAGFIGVMPRWMCFKGAPIRVAVFTQLMVAPESRGIAGVALLRDFFHGSQDLSLSDASTDVARKLCEQMGGTTALLYSMCWTRPIMPWRYAAARIGGGTGQRALRAVARPLLRVGDSAAARLPGSWFRQTAPTTQTTGLSSRAIVDQWQCMSQEYALRGCYDEAFLDFALREAARKQELGTLERTLVQDASGRAIGWYVHYVKPGDIGQVVHVAAAPNKYTEVLEDLFYHAWKSGEIAVRGRFSPKHWPLLEAKHCVLGWDSSWTTVHSRHQEILHAITRGDALLSRLDGEYWMTF